MGLLSRVPTPAVVAGLGIFLVLIIVGIALLVAHSTLAITPSTGVHIRELVEEASGYLQQSKTAATVDKSFELRTKALTTLQNATKIAGTKFSLSQIAPKAEKLKKLLETAENEAAANKIEDSNFKVKAESKWR